MKILDFTDNPVADGTISYNYLNSAESRPDSTPWVNITRANANNECQSIGTASTNKLINNAQWQSIARNLEQNPYNWTNGSVGLGGMYRGHSDNSPSNSLSAGDGTDGYYLTGYSPGNPEVEQRRTLKLSNNEEIWDFAGNVSEWILDDNSVDFGLPNFWTSITNNTNPNVGTIGLFTGRAKFHFGPFGEYITTWVVDDGGSKGLGYGDIYFGTGNPNESAIIRGGAYDSLNYSGLYHTQVHFKIDQIDPRLGFRCVYTPPPPL
jgi:formylglycine-generating enzyme required for sulfatase activity